MVIQPSESVISTLMADTIKVGILPAFGTNTSVDWLIGPALSKSSSSKFQLYVKAPVLPVIAPKEKVTVFASVFTAIAIPATASSQLSIIASLLQLSG